MAKTAAERQAEYRKKRAVAGNNGERRINTWVATGTALALVRLSNRYGVTQRDMLERLVLAADQQIVSTLDPDSQEWTNYFRLRSNGYLINHEIWIPKTSWRRWLGAAPPHEHRCACQPTVPATFVRPLSCASSS